MARASLRFGPLVLASVAALASLAGRAAVTLAEPLGFGPDTIYAVPLGDSPRRGPPDAPITIVEFSDFGCGYCNRAQTIIEHVDRLFPGQVRWVFRHFPLDEETGMLAAEAAAAAGLQGRFWPMHDRLFAVRGQVDRAAVELYATELGLDLTELRADLDSGAARAIVMRDWTDGRQLGISGTPTFFLNGRALVGGRIASFATVIAEELPRARAAAGARDRYDALTRDGVTRADTRDPLPRSGKLDLTSTYRIGAGLPGHHLGPEDAQVTVVMWSDFECPFCARMVPTLERLGRERPVRLVYRHLPIASHRYADLAAEAAVVAGLAGKFWPFYREIFALIGTPLTREVLLGAARRAGIDATDVARALDHHRYRELILADGAAASALGVGATPTLFINGRAVDGAPTYERLLAIVDEQLAEARMRTAAAMQPHTLGHRADIAEPGALREAVHPIDDRWFDHAAALAMACRTGDAAAARRLTTGAALPLARGLCRDFGVVLP